MWVSSCWSYKHKTQLATADSFRLVSFHLVSIRSSFLLCVPVCVVALSFLIWFYCIALWRQQQQQQVSNEIIESNQFFKWNCFSTHLVENLLTFSRFDFLGFFSVDFFLSCFCWVSISIWFSVFVCCASFPSPSLSSSMSCCVSLSLFDLYSNYFHNEINRPFPGCLHLPGSAESTWASFRIVSSNLLLSLSPSFSLWLSLLLPAVQLLSESMTNRKSGSDLVQRLRRM